MIFSPTLKMDINYKIQQLLVVTKEIEQYWLNYRNWTQQRETKKLSSWTVHQARACTDEMKYFQLLHKIKGNINECPKGISLWTIFRTVYGKMIKQIIFFDNFLYFLWK